MLWNTVWVCTQGTKTNQTAVPRQGDGKGKGFLDIWCLNNKTHREMWVRSLGLWLSVKWKHSLTQRFLPEKVHQNDSESSLKIWFHFSRFHVYVFIYDICFSLSDLLHSIMQTLGSSTTLQMTQFHPLLWLSNILLYTCTTFSLQGRNRNADIEKGLVDKSGEGEGGMN